MPSGRTQWTANSMIGAPFLPFATCSVRPRQFARIAGAGGGLVASVATCPLDVVKTKLQAQRVAHGHVDYLGVSGVLVLRVRQRLSPDHILTLDPLFSPRDCTKHHSTRRPTGLVSRAGPDHPGVPPDMGHLLCCVRRNQGALRATPSRHLRPPQTYDRAPLSRAVRKGLPARHARAPMVAPHPVRHGCRRHQHDMHESPLGYQDEIHGGCIPMRLRSA